MTKLDDAQVKFWEEQTKKVALEVEDLTEKRDRYRASEDATRIMPFNYVINKSSASEAVSYIGMWYREAPTKPITITFNSPGGSLIDGLAFFDHVVELRDQGATINTKAVGFAASMAAVLLQAGEERTIGQNAYLMIHEVSDLAAGSLSELEDQVKLTKRFQDRTLDILASRATISRTRIKRNWTRKDWWLDANQAIELGFADRIE